MLGRCKAGNALTLLVISIFINQKEEKRIVSLNVTFLYNKSVNVRKVCIKFSLVTQYEQSDVLGPGRQVPRFKQGQVGRAARL